MPTHTKSLKFTRRDSGVLGGRFPGGHPAEQEGAQRMVPLDAGPPV